MTRRALLAATAAAALRAKGGPPPVDERWAEWWREVGDGLAAGVAPGAACIVEHRGRRVVEAIWGQAQVEPEPVALRRDMRWDLASLTKPLATTSCALAVYEDGRLDLDAPVTDLLPALLELGGEEKRAVTARHLLTHSAGFPSWIRLYRDAGDRAAVREQLFRTPLAAAPGAKTTYSDLGFMTLGFLVEAITGRREDEYLRERLLAPHGLVDTVGYLPPHADDCVATERCAWRQRIIRGEVHDENAAACDGVAGHAGLFGTLDGVAGFARLVYERRLLAVATHAEQFRPRDDVSSGSFWLGWTRGDYDTGDETAFGHTGFTGTLIWASPARELLLVLLTNRVHPTRENGLIGRYRPRWVRAAWELAGPR